MKRETIVEELTKAIKTIGLNEEQEAWMIKSLDDIDTDKLILAKDNYIMGTQKLKEAMIRMKPED
jgi:hypothetical protein